MGIFDTVYLFLSTGETRSAAVEHVCGGQRHNSQSNSNYNLATFADDDFLGGIRGVAATCVKH